MCTCAFRVRTRGVLENERIICSMVFKINFFLFNIFFKPCLQIPKDPTYVSGISRVVGKHHFSPLGEGWTVG